MIMYTKHSEEKKVNNTKGTKYAMEERKQEEVRM